MAAARGLAAAQYAAVPWFIHSDKGANSLSGDGMLSTVPPSAERVDEFVYDPEDPVPSLGGTNLAIDMGVQDQRPVEQRVDVLVYTSDPLEQPVEITGPVSVVL
jgi:putative CocE/NonD family hydrolase